jgi:hypothetical protein
LASAQPNSKQQWAYDQFFISKTSPQRGMQVSFNATVIAQHIKSYTGFQALLSNKTKNPIQALAI